MRARVCDLLCVLRFRAFGSGAERCVRSRDGPSVEESACSHQRGIVSTACPRGVNGWWGVACGGIQLGVGSRTCALALLLALG